MLQLKSSILVLVLVTCVYCKEHNEKNGVEKHSKHPKIENPSYSFDQIYSLILKVLSCWEQNPTLSVNGTEALSSTIAFINQLFGTVPDFKGPRKDKILKVLGRLHGVMQIQHEIRCGDIPEKKVWWSYHYGRNINIAFKPGRVPKHFPFENKTIEEIIADTQHSPYVKKCLSDLYLENEASYEDRKCISRCEKDMFNMNYDSGITHNAKAYYISALMILNCTNLHKQTYADYAVHLCAYTKREVDTMLLPKNIIRLKDILFYFLRKVTFCAAWGIPEFLIPKIIAYIINSIDCHGCIATDKSLEERQIITTQTITLLGLLLRYIVQRDSGIW